MQLLHFMELRQFLCSNSHCDSAGGNKALAISSFRVFLPSPSCVRVSLMFSKAIDPLLMSLGERDDLGRSPYRAKAFDLVANFKVIKYLQ